MEKVRFLWNGLFDRNPESAEINAYLAGLGNGSITRSQVFKHVRTREEFISARDILLGHKTLHGQWQELPVVSVRELEHMTARCTQSQTLPIITGMGKEAILRNVARKVINTVSVTGMLQLHLSDSVPLILINQMMNKLD